MKLDLSKKMNFRLGFTIASTVIVLTTTICACGSKQTKDAEEADSVPVAADAGTDAVPKGTTENIPPAPPTTPPPTGDAIPPTANASPAPADVPAASVPSPAPSVPASSSATGSASVDSGQQPDSYKVQSGDTLMKIAFDIYGDVYKWREIYEANKGVISDPNSIQKDIVLKIVRPSAPATDDGGGEKYLIKSGDTLGKISAQLYGTSSKWKVLWNRNKHLIHDPNRIFAGFFLHYSPNGSVADTTASSPAADTTAQASDSTNSAASSPGAPSASLTPATTGTSSMASAPQVGAAAAAPAAPPAPVAPAPAALSGTAPPPPAGDIPVAVGDAPPPPPSAAP